MTQFSSPSIFRRHGTRERRRLSRPRPILAALLAGLVLVACGSDGTEGGGEPVGAEGDATAAGQAAAADDDEAATGADAGGECSATDQRLPEAPDRDLVALVPIPDGLTDDGDTFNEYGAVSGHTNGDADPVGAVACIDHLLDEIGWDVVHRSDEGSLETANGHAFVATHPELANRCLHATVFASDRTSAVLSDAGTRMEFSILELPEEMTCQF